MGSTFKGCSLGWRCLCVENVELILCFKYANMRFDCIINFFENPQFD